jgi:hypothetical protein
MLKFSNVLKPNRNFFSLFQIKNCFKNFASRDNYVSDTDVRKKLQEKWEIKQGVKKEGSGERFTVSYDVNFFHFKYIRKFLMKTLKNF